MTLRLLYLIMTHGGDPFLQVVSAALGHHAGEGLHLGWPARRPVLGSHRGSRRDTGPYQLYPSKRGNPTYRSERSGDDRSPTNLLADQVDLPIN